MLALSRNPGLLSLILTGSMLTLRHFLCNNTKKIVSFISQAIGSSGDITYRGESTQSEASKKVWHFYSHPTVCFIRLGRLGRFVVKEQKVEFL